MTYKIEVEFDSADALAEALEHIAASDATFAPTHGTVTVDSGTYALWSGYGAALTACRVGDGGN